MTYWTDVLLEREEVLALRPDPVSDILKAEPERLTLAEAVALLVRGRPAFLDEPLWVDPCADEIWTEFSLDDGQFNPVDRGYRHVVLKRQLSGDAPKAQGNLPQPEDAPYEPKNDAPDRADEVAVRSSGL